MSERLLALNGRGYDIRPARQDDLPSMLILEKIAWGTQGASAEMLESRIRVFPAGQIVALTEREVVGYLSFQRVDALCADTRSWGQLTDEGTIRRSHMPEGEYLFGVNLSVSPGHPGVGLQLQLAGWRMGIEHRVRGCFLGSRVPGYSMVSDRYSIEKWVHGKNSKSKDKMVRYYQGAGFRVVALVPNYFPDPESLNYGVLMYCPNIFYRLPCSRLWSLVVHRYGFTVLRLIGFIDLSVA